MDVAWVSEFVGGQQVIRATSGNDSFAEVKDGFAATYDGSYCKRVLTGELPSVIQNAREDIRTSALPVTDGLGIGSYVGVPIKRPDGVVFGMLCCVSRGKLLVDPPLRLLEALALAAGEEASARLAQREPLEAKRNRIKRTLAEKRLDIVVQPIVRLSTMQIVGVEALTRFRDAPARPDVWFADAVEVGMEEELELLSIECALRLLPTLPGRVYLSLNVSPKVARSDSLARMLLASDSSRLVLEITEQSSVTSYEALLEAFAPLRKAGIRLAVDDAGAGYASFNHILTLRPNIIKLDTNLTRNLDQDPVRLSLAEALSSFATRMQAQLVAEGVETQSELDALLRIDAYAVQGYLIGRPAAPPLKEITARPNPVSGAISSAGTAIRNEHDFEDYVGGILLEVMAETNLDLAYMTVLHSEDDSLEHRYVHPKGIAALPEGLTIPWRDSVCKRCRDAGIVWTADVENVIAPGSYADGKGVRTYLSMPIRTPANHNTLGTLCAVGFERRYLSDRVVSRVEVLARLIADRMVRDVAKRVIKASGSQV